MTQGLTSHIMPQAHYSAKQLQEALALRLAVPLSQLQLDVEQQLVTEIRAAGRKLLADAAASVAEHLGVLYETAYRDVLADASHGDRNSDASKARFFPSNDFLPSATKKPSEPQVTSQCPTEALALGLPGLRGNAFEKPFADAPDHYPALPGSNADDGMHVLDALAWDLPSSSALRLYCNLMLVVCILLCIVMLFVL